MKRLNRNASLKPETVTLRLTDDEAKRLRTAAKQHCSPSIESYIRDALGLQYGEESKSPRIKDSIRPIINTDLGTAYCADSHAFMRDRVDDESVDLIMTSPPFGLVRKKEYGNETANRYLNWFRPFAEEFLRILKPTGSLVIDIGGAWNKGVPTKSIYQYELLAMLCRQYGLFLAQEFFWWNPARLPTPAEWVNVRRVRVKDAVNCIWWLSKTPFPKASNRRILQPYSVSMRKLLEHGYTAKKRPSGHDISKKFGRDNGGAIPPNLIALANTESNSPYRRYCRANGYKEHPARFPSGLPAFFLSFLTDANDLVFDPFAGSCMAGAVSERMGRRWLCVELKEEYLEGAKGNFQSDDVFASHKGSRTEPYEIYPPTIMPADDEIKLEKAGGKKRLTVSAA